MRASLVVGSASDPGIAAAVVLQVEALVARGDEVRVYWCAQGSPPALPPSVTIKPWDAHKADWLEDDLILCDVGAPVLEQVGQAARAFMLLTCTSVDVAPWVYYVDACLVHDTALQTGLSQMWGIPLERILHLPDPVDVSQHRAYRADFARLVTLALSGGLPRAPRPAPPAASDDAALSSSRAPVDVALLRERADVMLRTYSVKSKVPLIGGIIAWVRRALTSHLREPYLDPTLERQVALNRDLIDLVLQLQASQTVLAERVAILESLVAELRGITESTGGEDADH